MLFLPGLQAPSDRPGSNGDDGLEPLIRPGQPYATPRAGQGFWADVLGYRIEVQPKDRSSFSAWSVGMLWTADVSDYELIPYGGLYFWRRPDDDHFLRATLVGVMNELLYARSPSGWGPYETVCTIENYTPPFDWGEFVDGERNDAEELLWGSLRAGIGLGWRETVAPWANDSMLAASLLIEPGFFYADEGADTAAGFVVPEDTFDARLHLRLRWDALERNVLELPHQGHAAGIDAIYGHRLDWKDWGPNAANDGREGADYALVTGYASLVTGVPGIPSDRHRLLSTFYAGVGTDLDRFSAPRIGGGPQGDEYLTISRPVVPGSLLQEFYPEHYAIAITEYRYEPIFFSYLGLVGSFAWLDRDRQRGGAIEREDDTLASLGARMSTGFFGHSRIQVEYHHNFGLVRDGERGGDALVFSISGSF